MRQVENIMGMAITLDIPRCESKVVFEKVFDRLRDIDRRFSPYKNNSELSKYQRGELKDENLSKEFKEVLKASKEAGKSTDGYFSVYFSGKFDPTGYVKSWAILEASKIIEYNKFRTYCIGAGGDVLARSSSNKIWKIGIQDPKNKAAAIGAISSKNFAIATSGSYERGKHIINPKTGEPADELVSVTVVGQEIIQADVFATAIFAEGLSGLILAEELEGYNAFAVDKSGDYFMTSAMGSMLELF
jgi:thiamine biosynthesis lipoprotein